MLRTNQTETGLPSRLERTLLWVNASLATIILLWCTVVSIQLVFSHRPATIGEGEMAAWSVLGLALFLPLGVGFATTAFCFHRHSSRRWFIQGLTLAIPILFFAVLAQLGR
jgi:hypothetical protein